MRSYCLSQIELQGKGRVYWQDQTKEVGIWSPYLIGSIDDNHQKKHIKKVKQAQKINGDSSVDMMYFEADYTDPMSQSLLSEMEGVYYGDSDDDIENAFSTTNVDD